MKRCCFKYFLLFFVFLQHSNLVYVFAVVEPQIVRLPGELSSDDGKVITKQRGKDIELLSGTGFINLTLKFRKLEFKVCKNRCMGKSKICYDSERGSHVSEAAGTCGRKYCELKIEGDKKKLHYATYPFIKKFIPDCFSSLMIFPLAKVLSDYSTFESCDPRIDRHNENMVQLWVSIDQHCPIIVKNAALHVPKTTSTSRPSSTLPTFVLSNKAHTSKKEESSEASLPWWAIFIIVFVGLLAFIGIGLAVYCICKNRQKPKKHLPPPAAIVSTTTVSPANPAPLREIPPKRNLNNEKPEPQTIEPKKNKRKKNKKNKKIKEPPPTTQDVQSQIQESPPKSPTRRSPAAAKKTKEFFPLSLISVLTEDEISEKEKSKMIEIITVSLNRHCLRTNILEEMNRNYPNIKHDLMKYEVDLISSTISEMLEQLQSIIQNSEQKLISVGCVFDEYRRLIYVSEGGRRLLQRKETPATTVYFAFGAEYFSHVSDDRQILRKVSLPLLMVISLQSRFSESNRRKACSILCKKLPKIRACFDAADLESMPYPINVIENSDVRDSKFYSNPSDFQTVTEGESRISQG